MHQGIKALECSESRDQLAWLVLRLVGKLSPCAKTSLIAYISGDYTTTDPPTGDIIFNALLKLKARALIQFSQEQIAITDEGRRLLDEPPVDALRPRPPYVAFLTALVPTSLAECSSRLKRFFQDCLARARAVTQRDFPLNGDLAVQIWNSAPMIGGGATTLVHMLRRFARACHTRAEAWAIILNIWLRQTRASLWKTLEASSLTPKAKLAGRSQLVTFGGALLVVALSIAAGFASLSGKRAESSQAVPIVFDTADRSGLPAGAAEPDAPATLITWTEAVRSAVQDRLSKPPSAREPWKREQGALVEYYSAPTTPILWIDENGLTNRAWSVVEEIVRADDYGLHASDYELPKPEDFNPHDSSSVDWLADAEIKISLAVLRYARDARGGRIEPSRLTANLGPTLALPDPLEVLNSIAPRGDPAVYLRSFQPNQPQFEALRQKLLEIKRQSVTSEPSIIISDGPVLRKGVEHEQVALLRKRLELSSDSVNENLYDDVVDEAVRTFQKGHGVAPDGLVGAGTRRLLNQQAHTQEVANLVKQRLILLNMERWRWLPQDLGPFYVTVNVPEFMARVVREGKVIHATRVVVGKPDKQTPIFSDEMQEVVFNPFWSVPNSIKVEEIRPYLREETAWFFGGWSTSVFQRHGLRIRYGGRVVDPGTIDWDRVDIRNLEIFQPPGPDNVLGRVKFVFPNKHDVYMHDTTQKDLFAKPIRAESHGCVRVENPDELAAIVLNYDRGWSAARVASAIENGYDQHVALNRKIPVHITYFTVWVNDDGSMSTFDDLYGHDARMAAALFGESVGFEYPKSADEVRETQLPRGNQAPWGDAASNDIVGSIIRLLED
jgi:murein L,D-transpeptidase YcbB/YkuD